MESLGPGNGSAARFSSAEVDRRSMIEPQSYFVGSAVCTVPGVSASS
jgi:hypothetical protein